MRRWLRVLVCLMVICSLLINLLPTRAKAVGISASAVSVAASLLLGLGISIGVDAIQHSELANNAVTALQAAGVVVTNGLMDVVSLGSGLFGVKSDTIQSMFDWLWSDSGVLDKSFDGKTMDCLTYSGWDYGFMEASSPMRVVCALSPGPSSVTGYPYMDFFIICPTAGATFRKYNYWYGDPLTFDKSCGSGFYYHLDRKTASYSIDSLIESKPEYYYYSASDTEAGRAADCPWWGDIETSSDLTLNFVAEPGISLATGYPLWAANSVTIPNAETGEDEEYFPIALGNSMEETQSFTQEQVWAGEGTYVDTETGTGSGSVTVPETVTLSDILAGVLSIPHAIATGVEKVVAAVVALPAAIVDGLRNPKPPDDHNNFALADLKNFFPFCIPFDLYAFFQLLNADPVAPVLSWEIQDLAGETYSLSVDLAEWDSVAQLFRRLQLFLFITGLAAASRKFIKW